MILIERIDENDYLEELHNDLGKVFTVAAKWKAGNVLFRLIEIKQIEDGYFVGKILKIEANHLSKDQQESLEVLKNIEICFNESNIYEKPSLLNTITISNSNLDDIYFKRIIDDLEINTVNVIDVPMSNFSNCREIIWQSFSDKKFESFSCCLRSYNSINNKGYYTMEISANGPLERSGGSKIQLELF